MNTVGSQFTVSRFKPDALASKQEAYMKAHEIDQKNGDSNATKDQIQFNYEGETTQVILNNETGEAMARQLDADGQVQGIEKIAEKIEVATRTDDGFAAQSAEEIPGTGDGWYVARDLGVTEAADPKAAFDSLNEQFEAEWKLA